MATTIQNSGTMDPTLTLPSSEQVAPGTFTGVSGISFSDSFAQSNPGDLSIVISDGSGTLSATDSAGTANGSGTNSIGDTTASYTDVTDILNSLGYKASTSTGSDTISFDIWDQAGIETTGTIPVTIATGGGGGGGGGGTTTTWTGATSDDWNTASNWSGGAVPTSGDTAEIVAGTPNSPFLPNGVLNGETITLDSSAGTPFVEFGTVTLGANTVLDGTGGTAQVGTLTIDSGATFAPTGTIAIARADFHTPSDLVNDGLITGNGTNSVAILGDNVVNNGTIFATNGASDSVAETLTNNGSILMYGGGLTVEGHINGGAIDLSGGGHIQLATEDSFTNGAAVSGFSRGDYIADFEPYDSINFNDNVLSISSAGTLVQSIPMGGGLGLGNFEVVHQINVPYKPVSRVEFAASGEASNVLTTPDTPDISAPAAGTIGANATLDLGSVSLASGGTMTLDITATTGTLFMNGATGSGTNHLSISAETSQAQLNADLASLTYVAGPSANLDAVKITADAEANPSGTIETSRYIPISVMPGSGGGTETWTGAVSTDWNTAGNWSGNAVPVSGDTVIIPGGTANSPTLSNAVLNGETIELGSSSGTGTLTLNDVTLNSILETTFNAPNNADGFVNIGGTLTIGSAGTVLAEANTLLSLTGTGETVVNNGFVGTEAGGRLSVDDQQNQPATATFTNNGSLVADGAIDIATNAPLPGSQPDWQMTNSGSVVIGDGGNFNLNGTFSGNDIAFTGTGALGLQQANALIDGTGVTGFGPGDQINLPTGVQGTLMAFSNGTLDIGNNGTITEAIPMSGSLTLGNFQEQTGGTPGSYGSVAYAPGGGTSGIVGPGVVAPAQDSVAQGSTLALNDVSLVSKNGGTIDNTTTLSLDISAGSGTLYMNGASGSGTSTVSVSDATAAQLNSELASLAYVPAAGASSDTIAFQVTPPAIIETFRWLPITITGSGGGGGSPVLTEPSSEIVASGGTVAVSGSYSDSFAQGNPGQLSLGITDSSGTLSATDASGNLVAGSGTSSISAGLDYADVNAVLSSLKYTAGTAGSDAINFDVWNQAGVESIDSVPVTVTSGGGGGGGGGPTLNEPASETVSPGGTAAVDGSYSDSFAQGNPGELFLGITDSSGTLSATDASGNAVAGSGTNSISTGADYVDLNAILASLHYTAGGNSGSDTIQFQVWNQAGTETTASTAVTIDPPALTAAAAQASASMAGDFPVSSPAAATAAPTEPNITPAGLAMLDPNTNQLLAVPSHSSG